MSDEHKAGPPQPIPGWHRGGEQVPRVLLPAEGDDHDPYRLYRTPQRHNVPWVDPDARLVALEAEVAGLRATLEAVGLRELRLEGLLTGLMHRIERLEALAPPEGWRPSGGFKEIGGHHDLECWDFDGRWRVSGQPGDCSGATPAEAVEVWRKLVD